MLANPAAFFAYVRTNLFGGKMSQGQVVGITAILDAWEKYGDGNVQRMSYMLGTPMVETGGEYQPIYEGGPRSYFDKYEPGTKIGQRLGNNRRGDGYLFRGRGLVQITGRANYARVGRKLGIDLIANPDLALDPAISARILVVGTLEGWFTGKGLSDYIDDVDEADDLDLAEFKQARRTVNGEDKASVIAGHALVFEKALKAGGWGSAPVPAPVPADRTAPANIFAFILNAILALVAAFTKRRA